MMTRAYQGLTLFQDPSTASEMWLTRFAGYKNEEKDSILSVMGCEKNKACKAAPVFVVRAGSLWFNLLVFSINAAFAILHLYQRRRKFGGELGGKKGGFMGQYFSGAFLISQW